MKIKRNTVISGLLLLDSRRLSQRRSQKYKKPRQYIANAIYCRGRINFAVPPRFADRFRTLCKVPTYLRPLTQASRCVILGKTAFERTLSGPFSKPFTAAFQLPRLSVSSYPAFISASSVWGYSLVGIIISPI